MYNVILCAFNDVDNYKKPEHRYVNACICTHAPAGPLRGGVELWVVGLTRDRWILVSR